MIVDALSSYMGVGPMHGKPSSCRIDLRYKAILAHETAARNYASVEQIAVIDWVLDRYTIAPPQ